MRWDRKLKRIHSASSCFMGSLYIFTMEIYWKKLLKKIIRKKKKLFIARFVDNTFWLTIVYFFFVLPSILRVECNPTAKAKKVHSNNSLQQFILVSSWSCCTYVCSLFFMTKLFSFRNSAIRRSWKKSLYTKLIQEIPWQCNKFANFASLYCIF